MINVALIGMGKIGLGFDTTPESKTALSHAKGIFLHPNFDLKYVADPNKEALSTLQNLFPQVQYTPNYLDFLKYKDIDLLVISTPTATHYEVLCNFESCTHIKLFFMEKPLFSAPEEYHSLPASLQERLIVNYPRRFEPHFQTLQKHIQNNKYGHLKKAIVHYSKGFINNGSHAIDFLHFLCGSSTINKSVLLDSSTGFDTKDDSLDIFAKATFYTYEASLYFIGFDHNYLTTFSVELFFDNAVIFYDDTTMTLTTKTIQSDPIYPEYRTTSLEKNTSLNMDQIMLLAYNDIFSYLLKKPSSACSFEEEKQNVVFKTNLLRN